MLRIFSRHLGNDDNIREMFTKRREYHKILVLGSLVELRQNYPFLFYIFQYMKKKKLIMQFFLWGFVGVCLWLECFWWFFFLPFCQPFPERWDDDEGAAVIVWTNWMLATRMCATDIPGKARQSNEIHSKNTLWNISHFKLPLNCNILDISRIALHWSTLNWLVTCSALLNACIWALAGGAHFTFVFVFVFVFVLQFGWCYNDTE